MTCIGAFWTRVWAPGRVPHLHPALVVVVAITIAIALTLALALTFALAFGFGIAGEAKVEVAGPVATAVIVRAERAPVVAPTVIITVVATPRCPIVVVAPTVVVATPRCLVIAAPSIVVAAPWCPVIIVVAIIALRRAVIAAIVPVLGVRGDCHSAAKTCSKSECHDFITHFSLS